ncbi:MAG: NAD/NADP octopine/nopaline dehydrogenase family protein [Synergistales bacterium]|nr:NAD/NADP octopine/nopaline dehydrogenase family protein [Synergistales bacterium]
MKFAVLGSGNGARAWAAQIAATGRPVSMWEPLEATEDYRKLREERKLYMEGDITAGGELAAVTMDIAEAMENAAYLLVVVPSFAHEPIFRAMIPHLKDGQHVLLVPGNYGGLLLKQMMKQRSSTARISISETSTMPYACRIHTHDKVMVFKRKLAMKVATSPSADNQAILDELNAIFKGYIEYSGAGNLLEMDLENINYTLHPLPVLLSYGAIERESDTFRHYMDGITPSVSELMMRMDEERLQIGERLGLTLEPCLSYLKTYYGQNDAATIYEYVQSPESPYKDLVGQSIWSRYLTEDVPGLVAPSVELAEKAGYRPDVSRMAVSLASMLHKKDYFTEGTTLEKLGIAGLDVEEILRLGD